MAPPFDVAGLAAGAQQREGAPPAGRDVLKAVRDKLAALSASIDEWESVTKNVNFPKD